VHTRCTVLGSDIDTCSRYNDPARQYSNLPTPAPEGAGAELMPRQRIKFYWEARREIWAAARSVSALRGFSPQFPRSFIYSSVH